MEQPYPRRQKWLAAVMGATGIAFGTAGFCVTGWACLLLAERSPKALTDWIALVFLSAIMVGFLVGLEILVGAMRRLFKRRTT